MKQQVLGSQNGGSLLKSNSKPISGLQACAWSIKWGQGAKAQALVRPQRQDSGLVAVGTFEGASTTELRSPWKPGPTRKPKGHYCGNVPNSHRTKDPISMNILGGDGCSLQFQK